MKFFEFLEITFDEKKAKVNFNIDFWAKIKGTGSKIYYSGDGSMTYKYKNGYWYLRKVNLPIND